MDQAGRKEPNEGHERALAKLTLQLRVTGVRADGYHLLDCEMVTVDLADELAFGAGSGLEVRYLRGVPPGSVDTGESNLVNRALLAVGRRARVRLDKRIPVGSGLGGGSADAAAVMRWAGVRDPALAATIGSDVPFCLSGGRARVGGAGEVVEPLPFLERSYVLLLVPCQVSTASVYAAWDEAGRPGASGSNDLEAAALAVEPRLGAWRELLGEESGRQPFLAGSGSTWFVEGGLEGSSLEGREALFLDGERAPLVPVRSALE